MPDEALPSLADIAADALDDVCSAATTALGDDPAAVLQPVIDAVLAEAAAQRWINKQLEETGIRAMDFRNGMDMELEPARELLAHWVAAARTMLGDAPNYTETKVSMDIKLAESPELYTLVVQRHALGALTPHEARQKAEARVAELEAVITNARKLVSAWLQTAGEHVSISTVDAVKDNPLLAGMQEGRANQYSDCANELRDVLDGEDPDGFEYGVSIQVATAEAPDA